MSKQSRKLSEEEKALVGEYLEILLQIALRVHKKMQIKRVKDDRK